MASIDIALVMCPAWGVEQPPVGISYLKAFLGRRGVRARCFDLNLDCYKILPGNKFWDISCAEHFMLEPLFNKNILPVLVPLMEKWADEILRCQPKVVGFSLFMSSVNASMVLAGILRQKRPDLLIVGGGPEVTRLQRVEFGQLKELAPLRRDILLKGVFDMLVAGEGEETLCELIVHHKRRQDVRKIKGLVYLRQRVIVENPAREPIRNIDVIDPPDYADYDLGQYIRKSLPLVTSRGCVNRCTFCADSPLWRSYRVCSPRKVVDDIRLLQKKYSVTEFEFTDSLFNGDVRRVEKICDLLIRGRYHVRWAAKVSLSAGMTADLLKKMRAAGCDSLSYGLESGSPDVLRDMRKNADLAVASRVIRDTALAGIRANCFIMVGFPTETEKDFQLTLDFVRQNSGSIDQFANVSSCNIEEDTFLGRNLDHFGIFFKEDGWHSEHSTPTIRMERLRRVSALKSELTGQSPTGARI